MENLNNNELPRAALAPINGPKPSGLSVMAGSALTAREYEDAASDMRGVIENLSTPLRRAARKLSPSDPLRTQCVAYLKEIGQAGQPLRAWSSSPNVKDHPRG